MPSFLIFKYSRWSRAMGKLAAGAIHPNEIYFSDMTLESHIRDMR